MGAYCKASGFIDKGIRHLIFEVQPQLKKYPKYLDFGDFP